MWSDRAKAKRKAPQKLHVEIADASINIKRVQKLDDYR